MNRATSQTVISAFRCTSIVDTPMRKVEVLEAADGRVIIRQTDFEVYKTRAEVSLIVIERYEAQAIGKVLLTLDDDAPNKISDPPKSRPSSHMVTRNGTRALLEKGSPLSQDKHSTGETAPFGSEDPKAAEESSVREKIFRALVYVAWIWSCLLAFQSAIHQRFGLTWFFFVMFFFVSFIRRRMR